MKGGSIQDVSSVYTSPFLDTDDLKMASRARKVSTNQIARNSLFSSEIILMVNISKLFLIFMIFFFLDSLLMEDKINSMLLELCFGTLSWWTQLYKTKGGGLKKVIFDSEDHLNGNLKHCAVYLGSWLRCSRWCICSGILLYLWHRLHKLLHSNKVGCHTERSELQSKWFFKSIPVMFKQLFLNLVLSSLRLLN